MPLVLSRTFAIYQLSFLLVLFGVLGWTSNWRPAPAMAATRLGTYPGFSGSSLRPPTGRRFEFLAGGAINLAPRSLSESERYDYYAALCAHYGLKPSGTTVLGLRGLTPNGRRHPSGDNMSNYDDTFVVLHPSERTAREFLGSTHAGQAVSSLSPAGGVAQIQPGLYWAEPVEEFNGMAAWWLTDGWGDGRLPCWRDANGNGFIDTAELANSLTATEILFHNGRNQDYGTSIGCQVLPPDGMRNFINTVGETESFDYVLVDANRPIQ